MLRYGLVFLTWGAITGSYYLFSHYVHHAQLHFERPQGNHSNSGGDGKHDDGGHGRGGPFDKIHDKWDWLFLYGLAVPLVLLTLATLIWNPSSSARDTPASHTYATTTLSKARPTGINASGEVNVQKWTFIWFVLPLFLVMLDGARGHSSSHEKQMGWSIYIRICMSLMSPSGYAATWSLSLFLIPVSKHSPILDWLHVTPVQALSFHRIAGWVGFWNSVLHGFLHLRHLMDVLNPLRARPWYTQLKILLVPSSWKCFLTQNPFSVFFANQVTLEDPQEARQCWLALVNATGMVSVIAYLVLAVTSVAWIRRYSYTLFYRVHIPAAWVMLFNAIWHYPTCALILIPNILYYMSFYIPVYFTQYIENKRSTKTASGPLMAANLIKDGSVELVFATKKEEIPRHESRYVKLSHPSISPISHPFSVFSREDLMGNGNDEDGSSLATLSILLRPNGSFTQGVIQELFPSQRTDAEESAPALVSASSSPSSHIMLHFESFYAGCFDWVNSAMKFHDEITLVAGGVGISPFLEFLPSLQQRIARDSAVLAEDDTQEVLIESNDSRFGPRHIILHWYCRELCMASHIWHTYLCHHVKAWENNAACRSRLKIQLHLTSFKTPEEGHEDVLTTIPKENLVMQQTYPIAGESHGRISPARDAYFTQSWLYALLVPGSIMVIGTILHWWWYMGVAISDKFRNDGLVLRSHSVVFTLLFAAAVSFLVEHCITRFCGSSIVPSLADTVMFTEVVEDKQKDLFDNDSTGSLLLVNKGRPSIDDVIAPILKASQPGVYLCGPHSLLESVENAIRLQRTDCGFYREDSEM